MMENISRNFTYHELVRSRTATRLEIYNIPSNEEIENAKYLADNVLQPLRDWYKSIINTNSWYRCELLNNIVGSNNRSLHRLAAAVDVDSVGEIPLIDVVEYIYNNLPFTELIAEYLPYGWIHVGLLKGRENDKVLKLKDKDHNYLICKNLKELRGLI